ncbi:hypothetical protein OSTOST_19744, partial [Ostertagia ostertagi]
TVLARFSLQHPLTSQRSLSIAKEFVALIAFRNSTSYISEMNCRVPETRHSWSTLFASWVEIVAQALLAPAAWLFVVFLDGGYYRCLLAHNYCPLNTSHHCVNITVLEYYKSSQEFDKMSGEGKIYKCGVFSYLPALYIATFDGWDAANLEAQSQIYAWMILLLFGVGTFLVICIVRMCDKYTYVQRQYVETYKNEETNKFDGVAKEHAATLAERNARAFFNHKDWSKRDWDWVSGILSFSTADQLL